MKPDKKYCAGCDQDYYNHENHSMTGECWSFKSSRTIKRYCIGWWTPQDKKGNFGKTITTNSCHTETGRFAYYNKLPEHLTRSPHKEA